MPTERLTAHGTCGTCGKRCTYSKRGAAASYWVHDDTGHYLCDLPTRHDCNTNIIQDAKREVINGYDIDILARSLYDARTGSAPATDEVWARHAVLFPSTHRRLFEEARSIAHEED